MRTLLLGAIVLATDVRPADACSCAATLELVAPRDGATQVATNTAVFLRADDPAAEVTLRGGDGEVALVREVLATGLVIARPATPLAPNTTYEIAASQFDITRTARFTTGSALDEQPPHTPTLRRFAPELIAYPTPGECASSCVEASGGDVSRVRITTTGAELATLLVLELVDGAVVREAVPLDAADTELGHASCGLRSPHWTPDVQACARVVAYDAAGHAATSAPVCATPVRCASEPHPTLPCELATTCTPETGDRDPLEPIGEARGCATGAPGLGGALLALTLLGRRRRLHR